MLKSNKINRKRVISNRIEQLRDKLNYFAEENDFSLNANEMYSLSTQLDLLIFEYFNSEPHKRRDIRFFTKAE